MESWLLKILNIRKEEQKAVYLMMIFSFFVGLSMTFYFTAANAIFLKHFKPGMISLSYIASGVMVYLAWWMLSRLDKNISLPRQLFIKILFVFLSVLAIGLGVWLYDTAWLAFILFTWIRVLVYITLITFWGLAGKLFNLRQGKRIFGLIGVGEVLSIIIGYFSVPLFLQFLKAADLLFLSTLSLMVCLVLIVVIIRQFRTELGIKPTPQHPKEKKSPGEWNYWRLVRQPYFFLISLMALLPIFGYLSVDYLFLAQTKREFVNNTETIARFLGIFLGFTAVIELVFKLVSGRFLNKYGIRPSLVVLPAILVFSILLATVFGFLYGTLGLFFAFIAFARLFERAIRSSLYEPAFQLLYQPVPEEKRLVFQNQIEGIPKALGTIITGAVIFGLSAIPDFNLVHFNLFFLIILALWIWMGYKMYDAYRTFIKQKLAEMAAANSHHHDSMLLTMENRLRLTGAGHFKEVFMVYWRLAPEQAEKALERCFTQVDQTVQQIIAEIIRDEQMIHCRGMILRLMKESLSPGVKEMLGKILQYLDEAADLSPETLALWAKSEDPSTRERVARLLGGSNRYNSYRILQNLLKDPDPAIRKAALLSSGRNRRQELWPILLDHLNSLEYSATASTAIKMVGEPILEEVNQEFEKMADLRQARTRIIQMYGSIGGETVVRYLRSRINHPDKDVQYHVLLSLCNQEYHAAVSERPYIRQTIEEVVQAIVWIMASIIDIKGSGGNLLLQSALLQEMEDRKENLFLLLSLLYESQTIRHIRESIESQDKRARIYALEICDMTVSDEIKEIFLPLFEDITIQEGLQRFAQHFPQEKLHAHERLIAIIQKDYSGINIWTKSCAIEMLGGETVPDGIHCEQVLSASIVHPERMVREVAARALMKRNPAYYQETLQRYRLQEKYRLLIPAAVCGTADDASTLIFDIVLRLKDEPWLSPVPETLLVPLAERLQGIPPGNIPIGIILDFIAGNTMLTERFLDHLTLENR